jgi:glycosyl transferase family 25
VAADALEGPLNERWATWTAFGGGDCTDVRTPTSGAAGKQQALTEVARMHIFLITLRDSHQNRNACVDYFRSLGLEPEVVWGVRGRNLNKEVIDTIHPPNHLFRRLKPGEIGCYLSHHIVFAKMVQQGIPRAFIFEDDVRFVGENPKELLKQLQGIDFGTENFNLNLFTHDLSRPVVPVKRRIVYEGWTIEQIQAPLVCMMGSYLTLAHAEERLARAFPIVRSVDVYGHLKLSTTYLTIRPDMIGYAPGIDSGIGGDDLPLTSRLVRRLCPRGSRTRFFIDQAVDALTNRWLSRRFWSSGDVTGFLAGLEAYR